MESFKEFFSEMGSSLKGRLVNPLYMAFLFAWATLNYRLIFILIGDGKSQEKLLYIDAILYPGEFDWLKRGFAYPLATALFFTLVSPFVYRAVMYFLKTVEKHTITIFQKVEDETPPTRTYVARIKADHVKIAAKLNAEIASLEVDLEHSAPTIDRLTSENLKLSTDLASLQLKAEDAFSSLTLLKNQYDEKEVAHDVLEKRLAIEELTNRQLQNNAVLVRDNHAVEIRKFNERSTILNEHIGQLEDRYRSLEKEQSNSISANAHKDRKILELQNELEASRRVGLDDLTPDESAIMHYFRGTEIFTFDNLYHALQRSKERIHTAWGMLHARGLISLDKDGPDSPLTDAGRAFNYALSERRGS